MAGWNWQKIKQKLSNALRLNFCFLKIICFIHPSYHPKIAGDILKKFIKSKCVCFNEFINDNENEAENEKKITYKINGPRPRHGHKYTKYKI